MHDVMITQAARDRTVLQNTRSSSRLELPISKRPGLAESVRSPSAVRRPTVHRSTAATRECSRPSGVFTLSLEKLPERDLYGRVSGVDQFQRRTDGSQLQPALEKDRNAMENSDVRLGWFLRGSVTRLPLSLTGCDAGSRIQLSVILSEER
jgi:hypothetical protein